MKTVAQKLLNLYQNGLYFNVFFLPFAEQLIDQTDFTGFNIIYTSALYYYLETYYSMKSSACIVKGWNAF